MSSRFDASSKVTNKEFATVAPPPRWLIIVTFSIVLLMFFAASAGVYVFQNSLRPGQQQRVINALPFMQVFVNRPDMPRTLPTALVATLDAVIPSTLPSHLLTLSSPAPIDTPVWRDVTSSRTVESSATPVIRSTPTIEALALSPTPEPVGIEPLPSTAFISGLRHEFQTWNNCGPATITIALSHFGWAENQAFAASFLKPNEEDKNVTPREMVQFVNSQTNVRALTRMGGTLDLVRAFISRGFPVIVSIGYAPEGEEWFGHYRAVIGYDDLTQDFYAYDSYLGTGEDGRGLVVSYDEFDSTWQDFNRNFIVLYEQGAEERIASILGERGDVMRAAELALETAQRETELDPRNGFAWFNQGTALVALERYDEAALAYDMARQHELPWRMLWYQFGPYEAYFAVGRLDDVTALVMANLNNGGTYVEETHFWQGQVYLMQGETDNAIASFRRALEANPLYSAAQDAIAVLEAQCTSC